MTVVAQSFHADFRMLGSKPYKVWCHGDWRDVGESDGKRYCTFCAGDISERFSTSAAPLRSV